MEPLHTIGSKRMNGKRWVSGVLVAALSFGSVASFAQGRDRDFDRRDQRDQRFEHRFDHRFEHRNDTRAMGNRGDWREHGPQDRYYYSARGPEWRRGGYLPPEYRNHQYVVSNWRAHHLAAPPRGYQWVQVGNDYVLAAIATGLIASLILNSQY
jgi:Ni/Co efflux regulator RcnB